MSHHLDIDPSLDEKESISRMRKFIGLCGDTGKVLLALKLGSLMLSAYFEAGMNPHICINLLGSTGMKKTTYASYLIQTYDRKKSIQQPVRLTASLAASTQILMNTRDDVVIFDDLCPSDYSDIKKQQEETFTQVIRYVGDGSVPARLKGKSISEIAPQCSVLFTSEYNICTGSDAARVLTVNMNHVDDKGLEYFQDRPLIVSTFYHHFVKWFVNHYDAVVDKFKKKNETSRETQCGFHKRLQQTIYFLHAAYDIFLRYCFENQLIEAWAVKKEEEDFWIMLDSFAKEQEKRVRQKKFIETTPTDYIAQIRNMVCNNQLTVAPNKAQFSKGRYDALIYDGCIYITSQGLHKCFPDYSFRNIIRKLKDEGYLQYCENEKQFSKHIFGLGGQRFYVFHLGLFK